MIFLGLLLRLALMPITMHGDLLFTNYFPHFLSYHGVWDIYGYFGDHYLKQGFTYYAPLVYYLTGLAQWVFRPLNIGFDIFMNHTHTLMYSGSGGSLQDYLGPFSRGQRLQYIFIMKLPYLLADALCVFLVAKIFGSGAERKKALTFWIFSPVLIFSVYIFGTYRIYPALAIWLFIYLVQKDEKVLAALVFGLLCLMDNFPWLLFAPVFWVLGKDWRERTYLGALALGLFAVIFGSLYVASDGYVQFAYFSPLLKKVAFQSLTNHFAGGVSLAAKAMFVLFYGLIFMKIFKSKAILVPMDPRTRSNLVIYVGAAIMFLFYATSPIRAHYFMWGLPFFVALQAKGEPWQCSLTWFLIGLLFLFSLDTRTLNLGLLMPLDPEFFLSMRSLHEVMDRWLPWGKVVAASRFLFSLICLVFVRNILRDRLDPLLKQGAL